MCFCNFLYFKAPISGDKDVFILLVQGDLFLTFRGTKDGLSVFVLAVSQVT